jgi:Flp pilus assembly secretin CpaC
VLAQPPELPGPPRGPKRDFLFELAQEVRRVVVRGPAVVAAQTLAPDRIRLEAGALGQTEVSLFVQNGEQVQERRYQVEVTEGALSVREAHADGDAEAPAGEQKTSTTVPLVGTQVRVIEISREALAKLRPEWTTPAPTTAKAAGQTDGSLASVLQRLEALEKTGEVRLLASPELLALAGTEALFVAGAQAPIPRLSASPKQGNDEPRQAKPDDVDYRPYGVVVSVTRPEVTADGDIIMQIQVEASAVTFDGGIEVGGQRVPVFYGRRITNSLLVAAGKTIVLGGLLSLEEVEYFREVPFVRQAPVPGILFRREGLKRGTTELAAVVTTRVVEEAATCKILEGGRPGG